MKLTEAAVTVWIALTLGHILGAILITGDLELAVLLTLNHTVAIAIFWFVIDR